MSLPRLALLLTLSAIPSLAAPLLSKSDAARILAAVKRLEQAGADEFRFAIVEDGATKKYVQFGSWSADEFEADFPISGASSPHPGDRVRMDGCSEKPVSLAPGEKAQRLRSRKEERALLATLDGLKLRWRWVYCIEKDVNDARVGFMMSIIVPLKRAEDAPLLVERVFADV